MIESGQVATISELANRLDVDASYVARILKLTTLSPTIVEAILMGNEPDGLSLNILERSFPKDWKDQNQLSQDAYLTVL